MMHTVELSASIFLTIDHSKPYKLALHSSATLGRFSAPVESPGQPLIDTSCPMIWRSHLGIDTYTSNLSHAFPLCTVTRMYPIASATTVTSTLAF